MGGAPYTGKGATWQHVVQYALFEMSHGQELNFVTHLNSVSEGVYHTLRFICKLTLVSLLFRQVTARERSHLGVLLVFCWYVFFEQSVL